MEMFREEEAGGLGGPVVISMYSFFTDYFYRRYGMAKAAKKQMRSLLTTLHNNQDKDLRASMLCIIWGIHTEKAHMHTEEVRSCYWGCMLA